jgi:hypothetical protein
MTLNIDLYCHPVEKRGTFYSSDSFNRYRNLMIHKRPKAKAIDNALLIKNILGPMLLLQMKGFGPSSRALSKAIL